MTLVLVSPVELLTSPFVAVAVIEIATVGLAFVVGRTVLRSRVLPPPPKPAVDTSRPLPSCPPSQNADPFLLGSSREHRSSIRRSGSVIEVRLADALGEIEIGRGVVVDRSTGGLGLEVNVALEPGTVVSVRPSRAEQRSPWVQIEIANCTEEGHSWRVGCKFVRTPPWSVMLLFH